MLVAWLGLALAGAPEIRVDGTTVSVNGVSHAHDGSCTVEVARTEAGGARILWVCDASLDRFGTFTELVVGPDGQAGERKTFDSGIDWVVSAVDAHAGDPAFARGIVARWAGQLQLAATEDDRERVLASLLKGLAAYTRTESDPERAARMVLGFLQSPPVWETDRPWDFDKRLRVGAFAGNRPAPERIGWLTATPERADDLLTLSDVLADGGFTRAATEIVENVAKTVPERAEAAGTRLAALVGKR
jgi:hypothetical protein